MATSKLEEADARKVCDLHRSPDHILMPLVELERSISEEGEQETTEREEEPPVLQRAPSSPSNSWSSGETAPVPQDSPGLDGDQR